MSESKLNPRAKPWVQHAVDNTKRAHARHLEVDLQQERFRSGLFQSVSARADKLEQENAKLRAELQQKEAELRQQGGLLSKALGENAMVHARMFEEKMKALRAQQGSKGGISAKSCDEQVKDDEEWVHV